MLEKLSVFALPLIALVMVLLLVYALWPKNKQAEPGVEGVDPVRNPVAARRRARR